MISIISVNWNGLDWIKLLIKSVHKFTTVPYEIIILDNNSEDGSREWLYAEAKHDKKLRPFFLWTNVKHGPGLDIILSFARYECVLILDSDAHILRHGWEKDLIDLYRSNEHIRLVAAKGGDLKPIHPCVMFFEPRFFLDNDLSFVAREGYDVGRKNYFDILNLGYKVGMIPVGYEEDREKYYRGAYGDIYYLDGRPTFYHQWYSSRFWQKEQVDDYRREDFERHKKILFAQPLVKEILAFR